MENLLVQSGITYSDAENADIFELKKLWLKCFNDVSEAVNMFFEGVYDPHRCFIAKNNGETVAMLFLIPCLFSGKNAHYLYAACTAPNHRGKNIMRSLIDYAMDRAKNFGDSYSFLLPASKSLYGYYEKSGYVRSPRIYTAVLNTGISAVKKSVSGKTLFPEIFNMNLIRENLLRNSAHLTFENNIIRHAVSINHIYGGLTVISKTSYALVSAEENGVRTITEIMADGADFDLLLNKIRRECPAQKYILRLPIKNTDDNNFKTEDFGMVRSLDGSTIPENIYIGLTLD